MVKGDKMKKTRLKRIKPFLVFLILITLLMTNTGIATLAETVSENEVEENECELEAVTNLTESTIVNKAKSFVGTTQSSYAGYCLKFAIYLYKQAGASNAKVGGGGACCAHKAGNILIRSTSRDVPKGALVFFSGPSSQGKCGTCGYKYGHVGVYTGDGVVSVKSSGKVTSDSISAWESWGYAYRGWGYPANVNIVSDNPNPTDTTPPTIKDIEITDVDNTGYTVFCTVTDNVGIGKVQFPTWTNKNGQDDIAWKEGFQVGSNTSQGVTFRVKVSEHNNEEGTYNTHIYAWDTSGNQASYPIQTYIDRTPPTITNVKISNGDSTGYTVTCNVTDNLYVNRVQFPTWTELNGQDDIISEWWNNSSASGTRNGTTFTYRVNRSAHNMELYNYHTHIYAYDDYGNYSMAGIDLDCVLGEKVDLGKFCNVRIKNAGTGTYLTYGASNVYGEKMKKFSQNQEWFLIRLKDGSYCIWALWHGDLYRNQEDRMEVNIDETDAVVSLKGGKVLDVDGAVNANGTNVQVYASNNTLAQKWNIYKAPKGYYLIPQCSVDQALDLDATSQNLQTHLCWNGTPQFFYIEQYEDDQENSETNKQTSQDTPESPPTNNQNDRDIPTTNQPNTSPADNSNVEQKQDISTTDFVDVNKNETDANKDKITDFVSRMYTVALNRNAEENGLKDWTNKLQTGEIDGAVIAWGFIGSQEFANRKLSNSDYIDVLYRTFFDREADTEGKSNWLSRMNAGTSREEVLNGFVNSQEFDNLCDSFGIDNKAVQVNTNSTGTGVRGYVLRMYTKALNREGEQAGVEDWTNRINTRAMSPEAVAKSFFFSQEFANRHLSNEDYVETLYQTFMDRASDAGGKQYWMNKLNSGMSRQQVLEGFSRSEEFSKIMKRYGL